MWKLLTACMGSAGILALAACMHMAPPISNQHAWNFVFDGQQAKLAYGRPNSDEVGLMMTCAPKSGAVTVAGDVEAARPALTLRSGRASSRLTGPSAPDPMTGGTWMEAPASSKDRTLVAFARTGKLEMQRGDRKVAMPASGEDHARVRQFFATCDRT